MPNNPMTPEPMSNSERRRRLLLMQEHDAQLIASTLQAAADRVCEECITKQTLAFDACKYKCKHIKAILSPLNKPDTFEPHENDGQTA